MMLDTEAGTMTWPVCPRCHGWHGPLPYHVQIIDQPPGHNDVRFPGHPYRVIQTAQCPTTKELITLDHCLGAMPMDSLKTSRQRLAAMIERGEPIPCSAEGYHLGVRRDLQGIAQHFREQGDERGAERVLIEVARLDALYPTETGA